MYSKSVCIPSFNKNFQRFSPVSGILVIKYIALSGYQDILRKLGGFTKKYYTKQLIRGSILFLTLGLLFWMAVMFLEYLLWMDQQWRLTFFIIFLLVESFLLYKFIVIPLMYLFRLRKGIGHKEASKLIGKHFPDVDDKLLNLLELSESQKKTDLLLASIEQRAKSLGTVPFVEAVDYRESYRYAKYVLVPLGLLGFIWVTGNIASFFNSNTRVMNYDLAYERPAPFTFKILNESLEVLDNEPLVIKATTEGSVKPGDVYLVVNGEQLLLQEQGGVYTYRFEAPVKESSFYLTANGWSSRSYNIKSYRTPALVDFQMQLDYPRYLNRRSEVITATGNAVVPEGTKLSWTIVGANVDGISMQTSDSIYTFSKDVNEFVHSLRAFNDLRYELRTSNSHVSDFERLAYAVDVVKDANPTVKVDQVLDSLNPNQSFFTGQAADDYGIASIRLVCFPVDDVQNEQRIVLQSPITNVHQFYYTFPSGLQLDKGKEYKIFFEVVDNDGIRGGKITKSQVFTTSLYDDKQLKKSELESQNSALSKMEQSLRQYKEKQDVLTKMNKEQKEERGLTFEDKSQIKDFLQKQQMQEELMQKFSKELKEGVSNSEESNEQKKMLQERLERQELEAKKNEKLLKELNELTDKMKKEELQKRLEELGKNQSKNARNLEQILELTKRYYVTEKMAQLANELEELAKEQERLSDAISEEDEEDLQKELNQQFDEISDELDELRKDNDGLQKPLDFEVAKKQQEDVDRDQKEALEELEQMKQESSDGQQNDGKENAKRKQKSAAQKMMEMSQAMQQSASAGGSNDTEDAEMLRQILDNLVTFSFKQESLFDKMESADVDISQFSRTVRDQKDLRRLFEHVDDSLFALSLRRAELSEFVNEQITEVYYNIDKSLESIAENQVYQGASYQQYVINATNALADFLANILDNMQQNMSPGQGSGQGSDFQLPDIIKGQQSIQDKMNGSGQEGKSSGQKGEQKGGNGQQDNGPADGDKGKQQGEGKQSEGGNTGSGENEIGLNEVYEIYKEQQMLRQMLEKQLEDMLNASDRNLAKKLLQQMEDFENDLLENGITERTVSKANAIEHQLLKLESAAMEQGEKKERESETNSIDYTAPIITKPELLRDNQSDIEILNRQALPLRQNYKKRVKRYFKND